MHAVIDELGLIVVVNDRYTGRQCLVDLCYLFLEPLDYQLGVFIDSLENDSGDNFSLTIFRDRPLTNLVADLHSGTVADPNRRAAARIEHYVSDIRDIFDETQSANNV